MASTEVELKLGIGALPVSADKLTWSPEQTSLMESLGLKGVKNRKRGNQWVEEAFEAPPAIVQAFLHQSRTRGLDPFARQIYCIERGGKWGIEASIDGFRLQAERTRKYLGQTEAQWTDGSMTDVPLFHNGDLVMVNGQPLTKREYVWVDAWVSSTPPAAARVGILRDGFTEPIWGVASYAGYCPRDKEGNLKPTGQWQFNSANQLVKCAEMLGLRKAFPTELSGLYGAEEMDQAGATGAAEKPAQRPQAKAPATISTPKRTRDWAAEAAAIEDLDALTQLANEAAAAGELGLQVGLAGDNDDGTPHTVMQVLKARKAELEAVPPTLVDVPAGKAKARQWTREARLLASRDEVRELWMEARAAKATASVLDELDTIMATLPDPDVDDAAPSEWAAPGVASSEWVEGVDGEFVEQPMVLGDDS